MLARSSIFSCLGLTGPADWVHIWQIPRRRAAQAAWISEKPYVPRCEWLHAFSCPTDSVDECRAIASSIYIYIYIYMLRWKKPLKTAHMMHI